MSPLEFLQRLAALVPRPRLHLIRFHGVLAQGECVLSHFLHKLNQLNEVLDIPASLW
jgi:hypothetical protein